MKILKQFAVIFLLFWVSHGVSTLLPFTMPASVIGLLLMFGLLLSGVLKADSIREAAEFLQGNMTLFLLPVVTSVLNTCSGFSCSAWATSMPAMASVSE